MRTRDDEPVTLHAGDSHHKELKQMTAATDPAAKQTARFVVKARYATFRGLILQLDEV